MKNLMTLKQQIHLLELKQLQNLAQRTFVKQWEDLCQQQVNQ